MDLGIGIGYLLLLILILLFISMLSSNLGIGGGILYVPMLLIFFPEYGMPLIVPISLLLGAATNIPSAYNHWRKDLVDIKLGLFMMTAALFGAVWGAVFTISMPEVLIRGLFLLLLVVITFRMVYRFYKKLKKGKKAIDEDPAKRTRYRILAVVLISVITGFLSASLGIGGGVVTVSILILIVGFATRKGIGTSSFVIPAITTWGFLLYFFNDIGIYEINYAIIPILCPVVAIGAFVGSRLGLKFVKTEMIEVLFILVNIAVTIKMGLSVLELLG